MNEQSGFTLIELMVAIVILGVILAVAVPSYRGHVRKAKRVDAFTALTHMASLQEQYFSENRTYTKLVSDLGLSPLGSAQQTTLVENDNYSVWMNLNVANGGYVMVAKAINGQVDDEYKRFRIYANGKKQHHTSLTGNSGWVDNWPE